MKLIFNLFARFFRYLAEFCEAHSKPTNSVPNKKDRLKILLGKAELSEEEKKELAQIITEMGQEIIILDSFRER